MSTTFCQMTDTNLNLNHEHYHHFRYSAAETALLTD